MEIISHRVNTISHLKKVDNNFGVEIDIRTYNNNLILQHDPFVDGELFEKWLQFYNHGTLVLNIKEEGIEFLVKKLLDKFKIKNFFF